jgi:hypothetical protein
MPYRWLEDELTELTQLQIAGTDLCLIKLSDRRAIGNR